MKSKAKMRLREDRFSTILHKSDRLLAQCLFQIRDQIVGIFQAD